MPERRDPARIRRDVTGNAQPLVGLARGTLFALAFAAGVVAGFARPTWVRADPPSVGRH
jgi:hypothetical protein